jgi:hypothetical protein
MQFSIAVALVSCLALSAPRPTFQADVIQSVKYHHPPNPEVNTIIPNRYIIQFESGNTSPKRTLTKRGETVAFQGSVDKLMKAAQANGGQLKVVNALPNVLGGAVVTSGDPKSIQSIVNDKSVKAIWPDVSAKHYCSM